MPQETEALAEAVMHLQRQLHALEIVVIRTVAELEDSRPGLLGAIAGHVIFEDRPDAQFDEHLEKVDEQVNRLLIWARQYRGELE